MGEKLYLVLYEFSLLLMRVTILNVLWIIVDLPVFIVLIQIGLTNDMNSLVLLLSLLSLLLPVLFFPGTHALISSSRELIIGDTPFDLLRFFKYYKAGFKKSFLIGMVYTSLSTGVGYLFFIAYQNSLVLSIILIVLFFYLSIVAFYLLYIDAHFKMTMGWKIKQSLIFILKHPLFSFVNFSLFIALHYVLYSVSFILFVLFGTTLTQYATYYLFIRKIDKIKTSVSHT